MKPSKTFNIPENRGNILHFEMFCSDTEYNDFTVENLAASEQPDQAVFFLLFIFPALIAFRVDKTR